MNRPTICRVVQSPDPVLGCRAAQLSELGKMEGGWGRSKGAPRLHGTGGSAPKTPLRPQPPFTYVETLSRPVSGSWNMAVDEVLLKAAVSRGECFLRWYRWSEPTVSLGHFQNLDELDAAGEFALLPRVKRLTGGGAILHHHEWTYSCLLPAGHPLARSPYELYAAVHERIIAVLAQYAIVAKLRGTALPAERETFLCFGREDPNDVVLEGHKILGSAQRRRRGAVLQHGSLLMRRSEYAPQFPGVLDLAPTVSLDHRFVGNLIGAVAALLADEMVMTNLSDEDRHRTERIVASRLSDVGNGRVAGSGLSEAKEGPVDLW